MRSTFAARILAMPQTKPLGKAESTQDTGTFDGAATRRLLRKIDLRLIPFLALLYL